MAITMGFFAFDSARLGKLKPQLLHRQPKVYHIIRFKVLLELDRWPCVCKPLLSKAFLNNFC